MFTPSESFRVFKARPCIYDLEPSLHKNIGRKWEVITLDINIPSDWVGAMRNLWTSGPDTCDCDAEDNEENNGDTETGPHGYPCDKDILLHAAHTPTYNIDKTFPRGSCNQFVERYRNDIFRVLYNESATVAEQWANHIQDIVDSTNPFMFVTDQERDDRENPNYIILGDHHCGDVDLWKPYTVNLQKVIEDLAYIPNVNKLDHIWYSPTDSLGTNSLSKLINNINVGEVLDLLWNYFYHDYDVPEVPETPPNDCNIEEEKEEEDETCEEEDHAFDPYNTLKIDDELVFPVHIKSLFGYSDKVTLLTIKDDVLYDYHVNIRFKQNVEPAIETHATKDIAKPIVGEPFPQN